MRTSEAINELAAALAKAQGAIQGAAKDSANPFFKSHYADLASVWDACRGPLSANGLCIIQSPSTDGTRVTVLTRMIHSSGQWIEGELSATAKDEGPQSIGSTVTYLRRYSLQSFATVAPADDDGNAGQDQSHHQPAKRDGKKAEADKLAAEHGMTTGDKLAPPADPPYPKALAAIDRLDTVDKAVKLADWCEKQHVNGILAAKDHDDLALKIVDKLFEVCQVEADYLAADKLLTTFISKMRIPDVAGTDLRIKLADAKDAKLGVPA